jgi:mannan endo-1,4-beta-mannosidase
MIMRFFSWLLSLFLLIGSAACSPNAAVDDFARVEKGQFIVDGNPYYFVGANFWYGALLASEGEGGDSARLKRELDNLEELGVTNLRILVGGEGEGGVPVKFEPLLQPSPGVYNDTLLRGLDRLMVMLGKRKMKAVLYLNNSWEWSGGFIKYLEWAGAGKAPLPTLAGWDAFSKYVSQYHKNDSCRVMFENHVRFIVSRRNSISGLPYKDDPAIFSWQIANEPRPFGKDNKEAFAGWIGGVARLIKSLDPNHMVSTGSEGVIGCEGDIELYEQIHAFPKVDYLNIHIWPHTWRWVPREDVKGNVATAIAKANEYIDLHLEVAKRLGKPLVIEEFGYPREDFSVSKSGAITGRDLFYKAIISRVAEGKKSGSLMAGCNFWAWGGEAVTGAREAIQVPGTSTEWFWKRGDAFTGDPAHEPQGLYSVFAGDKTTCAAISVNNHNINKIQNTNF